MSHTLTSPRHQVDMPRFRQLMESARLDAILAWGGANFHYLTGFQNYFDNPGGSIALIPADNTQTSVALVANWVEEAASSAINAETAIRTFPLWLEIVDVSAFRSGKAQPFVKPSPRFDIPHNMSILAEEILARGLKKGRIGIEMNVISAAAFSLLQQRLPEVEFVECSTVLTDLRAIKSQVEIDYLREATRFAEEGLLAVASTPLNGLNAQGLKMIYDNSCADRAARNPGSGFAGTRVTASIGGDISPVISGGPVVNGQEPVFFDCGASIYGYGSDTGRTLLFTPPNDELRYVMDAVCAGMDSAIELLRPGIAMSEVFHAGQHAVRRKGLEWFTRGHIGHAMGLGMGEQAPYLSPVEQRLLEPGMVLALETPLYIKGLGGFQVEECFVITENGHEKITTLPRDFIPAIL